MQQVRQLLPGLLVACLLSGCTFVRSTAQTLQLLALSKAERQETAQLTPSAPTVAPTTSETPLLSLLRFVPNQPGYREWLTFGDVSAWYTATGMTRVSSMEEWQQLEQPQRDQWAFDLALQTLPPETLGVSHLRTEDLREFYGFSIFDAERFIEAGLPPSNMTIMDTSADPTQIAQALLAFGYTSTPIAGGTLYSLRGDNEIDLQSPTRTGQLGQLNRIALLDQTLIIGRATATVTTAVETAAGSVSAANPSLADDPIYHALATALAAPATAPFGQLVGVMLFGQPLAGDPLSSLDQTNEAVQVQLDAYAKAPLSPYLALGFATYRAGETTYLTLAVVFPTLTDGNVAATRLGQRLADYQSVITGRSLAEHWSLVQATTVERDGLSVALVTMQARTEDATGTAYPRPFAWNDMIYSRDLLFLVVGEPVRP